MNDTDRSGRWPACAGECAKLIRGFGPDATPLGAPDQWPRALRNIVDLLLRSSAEMAVYWGPDYVAIYNDAHAGMIGNKHPGSLGRPAREFTTEIWDSLEPQFDNVLYRGESASGRDQPFSINRNGELEQAYFDYAWSPVFDDNGRIGGVLCITTETTERMHATQALADSERTAREGGEHLQMAQSAGGVGVFSLDIQTDMLSVSSEYCSVFGLPLVELLPLAAIEHLRITRGEHMSTRETRVAGTAPLDVEYQIRRAGDGAVRWISRRGELVRDSAGKPVLMRGVVQDITDRKLTEATLRQSEARFRTLARQMPNQVWTATADGRLDWVSESMSTYAGLSHVELLGDGWGQFVHPDDIPHAEKRWAHALATGTPYENEGRLRRHDGAWRWHLSRAQPLGSDEVGTPLRWVGINTDIEDQKAAQHRLAQSVAERTRDRDRLWQLSADIMLIADIRGRIVAVNPAWQALLGWSEAQLLGRPLLRLLHPDDLAPVIAESRRLKGGQAQSRIESRVRHQDGSYRTLSWTAVPDEGLLHAVGRDVTALRESEARLRQSQKMEAIGQLTGGIAHDFNNLLQGITGPIELMRRRVALGRTEGLERYMDSAAQSARRAASLIQRLLAFSRRQTLDPKPTDVNELLGSMGELLHRTLGEHVRLAIAADTGTGAAFGDAAQLESAILNLAINARDAMPDGGELRIGTSCVMFDEAAGHQHDLPPGHYCAISVADTGTGMTPEVLAKAFDPFFTTKPIGQGTGLGLSMVYGFAQQSRGLVRIQSQPGTGTTVTLYLPRAHVAVRGDTSRISGDAHLPQGRGEVVLVVEDDPAVRLLVLDVLAEMGYRTVHAEDGASAIPILQSKERIDLLVSDVGLPGINGRQVAEIARGVRPGLPVLFMTGYAEHVRTRAEFLAPGMEMIAKPFAVDEFARLVQHAMRGRSVG
ncbi:PAS domain S-box protein [Variovorax sp. dw_308]|uniref:PAS domain S-box protein n=1 Tax=Variovorax sp. dw_308 TaxID=2721546 RepID=UPI001C46894C|nr:PAS domain S-box protein [Variovorax sp. dw_308]